MVREAVVSQVSVQSKSARWRIGGVTHLSQKCGEFIESGPLLEIEEAPHFSAVFSLRFYWGGSKENEGNQWISLWAFATEFSSKKLMWKPHFVLVNQDDGNDVVWNPKTKDGFCVDDADLVGAPFFADRNVLAGKGFLVDDTIILELSVTAWIPQVRSTRIPMAVGSCTDTTAAFVTDFAAMLASGQGSDVSLKAGNSNDDGTAVQPIKAHRVVLAARSPVFQRMFFGEVSMLETCANAEVCLSDVEPQIAECFVQFLYTGRIKDELWKDDDAVCHLLSAGHRYQVSSLVDACVTNLVSSLNEGNAAERLMLADLLGIDRIREAALEYMCASSSRLAKIQSTEAFVRLGEKRPHLALEIMSKMVPPAPRKRKVEPARSLPTNLADHTVAQLKQLCSECGISSTGNKQVLIERLQNLGGL